MTPIKLTICAFGPFANEQHISFDEFGKHPLFLINGATGAGKSTILDAICFALYGQTTGGERSATQMRCDFASDNMLTHVELEFCVGSRRFRILRIPQQIRAKSVGEGTTTQSAKATFWEILADATEKLLVSSSIKDADTQIKQLIGLDAAQFRQVMVLPQGKFRELLLADSKDREKIFGQLFQTTVYKKIEESLKLKASHIKKQVEQYRNQVIGILKSADASNQTDVDDELAQVEVELVAQITKKESAEALMRACQQSLSNARLLIERFSLFEQKVHQFEAHRKDEPTYLKNKLEVKNDDKAKAINAEYLKLCELEKQIGDLASLVAQNQERLSKTKVENQTVLALFATAQQEQNKVPQLQQTLGQYNQYIELVNCLSDVQNKRLLALDKAKLSEQELTKTVNDVTRLKTQIEDSEQKIQALQQRVLPLGEERSQLSALLDKRNDIIVRDKLNDALVESIKREAKVSAKLELANEQLQNLLATTTQLEMSWHLNQAALLAAKLNDNMPCPVCGAKEHPNKARFINDETPVTKAELDAVKGEVERLSHSKENVKNEYNEVKNQIEITQSKLHDLRARLGDYANITVIDFDKKMAEQQAIVDLLVAYRDELELTVNQLQNDKSSLVEFEAAIQTKQVIAKEHKEIVLKYETQYEQITSQLPSDCLDLKSLKIQISKVTSQIEQVTELLRSAQHRKDETTSLLDKLESENKLLTNQHVELLLAQSTLSTEWESIIAHSDFDSELAFKNALLSNEIRSKKIGEINSYKTKFDELSGVVNELTFELKDKTTPNLVHLESKLNDATTTYNQVDKDTNAVIARKTQLVNVLNKLSDMRSQNEKLEREYRVVGTLYEVSNGLTGDKVSLQRFVLSVLLDDVLIQATQRLSLMSKGRYQLIRNESRAKGNKASGLELEVEDAYTGRCRSVATLSGGESFMAALSLALGLSDVVQAYSGGVRLDTLFIDEGFGSLDPESLDLAIRTLVDLQRSGRMIGIISHVSELKQQLPQRIDVIATNRGSTAQLVH